MDGAPGIVIHDEHWPVLYLQYVGPITDSNWENLQMQLAEIMERGEPFGWINDARTPHVPNAKQRSDLVKFYAAHAVQTKSIAAVATVSTSAVVRGVVTALEWIMPSRFPHKMFPTVLEAEQFVRHHISPESPPVSVPSYPPEKRSRKEP